MLVYGGGSPAALKRFLPRGRQAPPFSLFADYVVVGEDDKVVLEGYLRDGRRSRHRSARPSRRSHAHTLQPSPVPGARGRRPARARPAAAAAAARPPPLALPNRTAAFLRQRHRRAHPRARLRGGGGGGDAPGLRPPRRDRSLVRGKTVTVKVNLTGWPFQWIGGRPPGETYVTHGDTALALAQILSEQGARRIRFVESQGVALPLEHVVAAAGWDVRALQAIGGVEFENTRNLGFGAQYARLPVPGGGRLFSYFDVNHSYAETDVLVSLCKMKEHATAAGITLSMKNLFGITPNSLYGSEGAGEDKLGYRGPVHGKAEGWVRLLPGEKAGFENEVVGVRVPRTIVDENLARPIHLAIVDGITTMRGGEGWWNAGVSPIAPGVIVAGFGALSTDAVARRGHGLRRAGAPLHRAVRDPREPLPDRRAGRARHRGRRPDRGPRPAHRRRADAVPLVLPPGGAAAVPRLSRRPPRLSRAAERRGQRPGRRVRKRLVGAGVSA